MSRSSFGQVNIVFRGPWQKCASQVLLRPQEQAASSTCRYVLQGVAKTSFFNGQKITKVLSSDFLLLYSPTTLTDSSYKIKSNDLTGFEA
jgi:hypothetical protein